jgi:hypothetical protein
MALVVFGLGDSDGFAKIVIRQGWVQHFVSVFVQVRCPDIARLRAGAVKE